jgi:hypothetical protein
VLRVQTAVRHLLPAHRSTAGAEAAAQRLRNPLRARVNHTQSEGGLSTKIHHACEGKGRPLVMLLGPGQGEDVPIFRLLLAAIRVPMKDPIPQLLPPARRRPVRTPRPEIPVAAGHATVQVPFCMIEARTGGAEERETGPRPRPRRPACLT